MLRTILLLVLAAVLLAGCILTWGSLGSAVLAFCLITMAASVVYQKFLTHREDDSFQMED